MGKAQFLTVENCHKPLKTAIKENILEYLYLITGYERGAL